MNGISGRRYRGTPRAGVAVQAIALNTFREAIRDRVLYLLLVFAILLIGVSRLLSLLTIGSEVKIIKDVGLSAISLFGVLTAVFVGVSLVFKEIERRTVYTLLANPVRRWHFVTGKFVGLLAVVSLNVLIMFLALALTLLVYGESPWSLVPAVLLIIVELAIITAFALLFSSLTNPILAAVWTMSVYVSGHLSWSLLLLRDKISTAAGRASCDVVYWLLPNLDLLNIKAEVVHQLPMPVARVPLAVVYGVSYTIIVLIAACFAFERKDFN
jgi:ABC-type transport system involved in multi-copper enzyme maturation permease subunit